jgi:hypothetical protein
MVLHMGGRTYQQQHTKHLLMLGQIVGLRADSVWILASGSAYHTQREPPAVVVDL